MRRPREHLAGAIYRQVITVPSLLLAREGAQGHVTSRTATGIPSESLWPIGGCGWRFPLGCPTASSAEEQLAAVRRGRTQDTGTECAPACWGGRLLSTEESRRHRPPVTRARIRSA